MATNAEIAAKLLRDAARFFRAVGEDNEALRVELDANADMFEMIADRVARDPNGAFDLSRQ